MSIPGCRRVSRWSLSIITSAIVASLVAGAARLLLGVAMLWRLRWLLVGLRVALGTRGRVVVPGRRATIVTWRRRSVICGRGRGGCSGSGGHLLRGRRGRHAGHLAFSGHRTPLEAAGGRGAQLARCPERADVDDELREGRMQRGLVVLRRVRARHRDQVEQPALTAGAERGFAGGGGAAPRDRQRDHAAGAQQ